MKLRKLARKDAGFMLEWMHDEGLVKDLKLDFLSKTLDDCKAFIEASQEDKENIHLAITNEQDEYMGTVSLKHIRDGSAELGIAMRACAIGRGFAAWGMKGIIRIGFEDIGLDAIYWCVNPANKRAIGFYEKNGYRLCESVEIGKKEYSNEEITRYKWYQIGRDMI